MAWAGSASSSPWVSLDPQKMAFTLGRLGSRPNPALFQAYFEITNYSDKTIIFKRTVVLRNLKSEISRPTHSKKCDCAHFQRAKWAYIERKAAPFVEFTE